MQIILFIFSYKLFQDEKCLFLYNHKDRLGYKFQNQKLTSTLLRYNANSVLSSAFLFCVRKAIVNKTRIFFFECEAVYYLSFYSPIHSLLWRKVDLLAGNSPKRRGNSPIQTNQKNQKNHILIIK